MATRPTTTCPRCSTTFEAGRGKGPGGLYCAWACARAESQRLAGGTGRACLWCGGPVPARLDSRAIYCCHDCGVSAGNQRRCARPARTDAERIAGAEGRASMGRNPRSTVIALNWPYRLPDELASGTCASGKYPPDWWFPRSGDALGRERAQHMCRSCPALAACRAYVDACDSELRGIWAATTREEREQQRLAKGRERRRAARKAGDAA